MKRFQLLLMAGLMLAQQTAPADGGMVQLDTDRGRVDITLLAWPGPLSTGPVGVNLLLQDRGGFTPMPDGDAALNLRDADLSVEAEYRPKRAQAWKRFRYSYSLTLLRPGKRQVEAAVERNGAEIDAIKTLDVAPVPSAAVLYGAYVAFPVVMTLLFMVREVLIRRRPEQK
jgi:hypothetical protein